MIRLCGPSRRFWGTNWAIDRNRRCKHGFGLGREGTTTTSMLDQFTAWMAMHGFLTRK